MEEQVTYNAFQAFKPHFDALARVAYFKLVPKSESHFKNKLHYVYRVAVWVIVVTYNLQHVIKVIQERHSADQIVNILFILLTTLCTLAKQLAFNIRSKRLDRVFSIISGPVFAPQTPYHETVMRQNAVTMHRLLRFYIGCVFTCGALWTIFPLVNRAIGQEVEFTAYFPFDTQKSLAFELTVAYMNIFITFQAYGNVTLDCTIVAFYAQAKVQLRVLRDNLERLVDLEDKDGSGNRGLLKGTLKKKRNDEYTTYKDLEDGDFERVLQRRFVQCVVRHQQIKWFVTEIESIFAEPLLFQFFVIAWVICMTVYKIVGLSLFSAEFISMAMYLCCMMAQLFIYCYYGTQVRYESECVTQSSYFADWASLSPRFRRQLLVLMEICKRPITPRTAYIIPISLETYIAVLRASYTLFTFLDRK